MRIKSKKYIEDSTNYYDLTIPKTHSFVLANGCVVHNCGLGFSVQKHHVKKLPPLLGPNLKGRKKRYLITDNIEGWAGAVNMLCQSYFNGTQDIDFDYRDIRPRGTPLKTSGGKAPGAQPLKDCIHNMRKIFDFAITERDRGTQLKPIEAHDLICIIADCVLSGGIRRAACISFFSLDDEEMLVSKYNGWSEKYPYRARANNSALLLRHRIKREEFYDYFDKMWASGTGEPGYAWSNDKEYIFNPCFGENTLIQTKEGLFEIKDLVGKKVNIWDGSSWMEIDNFRITGKNQSLYRVTLNNGVYFDVTPYHKFILDNNLKIETRYLQEGMVLKNDISIKQHGSIREKGAYLKGFILADGCIIGTNNSIPRVQLSIYPPKYSCRDRLKKSAEEIPITYNYNNKVNDNISFTQSNIAQEREQIIGLTGRERDSLYKWGSIYKEKLPKEIFQWDEYSKKEFLAGLFDGDGTFMDTKKGFGYQLVSIYKEFLIDILRLLSMFGVYGKLALMYPEKTITIKEKNYICKPAWRIIIPQQYSIILSSLITFSRLSSCKNKKISYNISFKYNKVFSIEKLSENNTVYCCTIPSTHSILVNSSIITGQCGEATIRVSGGFCNLSTINSGEIKSQEDFNIASKTASFIGTIQASYTDFHYLNDQWKDNAEKDSLIGVSITGIASGNLDTLDLKEAANIVKNENTRVAKLIGINKAARCTLIKPEGSSSILLGTSSGIHAWFNDYFIRRVRIGKEEPIHKYLELIAPKLLEDEYFKPHLQSVLSVPVKAPEGAKLRNESAIKFLERVKRFNIEWIREGHRKGPNYNNVSCTISLKLEEVQEVKEWLWDNRDYYGGITIIPYDNKNYIQSPFEDITKEQYDKLAKHLHAIDFSYIMEDGDNTELHGAVACGGSSSCEIK